MKSRFAATALAASCALAAYAEDPAANTNDLEQMMFNNPDAVVELSMGVWAHPFVFDYDLDGDLDIFIRYKSVPSSGEWYFENPTPKGEKRLMPVFKAGKPGTLAQRNKTVKFPPYRLPDDKPYHDDGPWSRRDDGGWWWADLNGDGREDAVYVADDFSHYGIAGPKCPVAYDDRETWTNDQRFVCLFWREHVSGTGADTKWSETRKLPCGGSERLKPGPYGRPSPHFHDWDGDGDIDIVITDFVSEFWYYENKGTKHEPCFAAGQRMISSEGRLLAGEHCMMDSRMVDWDGDGYMDVISAEEDGRIALFRNTGRLDRGVPVLDGSRYFRQEARELKFRCFTTPYCCDWDGDGDWDIVCGDSAGFIGFIENLSGPGVERPKWAAPVLFTVIDPENSAYRWTDGHNIRASCGIEGSPQGPLEMKFGYPQATVADWDGDGFLDIVANDVKGSVVWFRNPGKKGATRLYAARPVEVEWEGPQPQTKWEWRKPPEGKALRAQWRTMPVAHDWNGDGLVDLIMLDHEGVLAFYERAVRDGKRVLLPPKRIFADEKGKPLVLSARVNGGSGRRKLCVTDWNRDGRMDFIINSVNAQILLNLGEKDGMTRFKLTPPIANKRLAGHPCCPTTADFDNDGWPDAVIAAEDGCFYYKRNPNSKTK